MYAWIVFLDRDPTDEEYKQVFSMMDDLGKLKLARASNKLEAWRMMVARLLPMWMLRNRGIPRGTATINETAQGKPYVASPVLAPSLAFNIAYKDHLVGLVFSEVGNAVPERIGIDIMKIEAPAHIRINTYILSLSSKLTPLERSFLTNQAEHVAVRRLFVIWTIKESYAKALGVGGAFEFHRLECDVPRAMVRLDGQPLHGWEFRLFKAKVGSAARGEMVGEEYQVACALYHGVGAIRITFGEEHVKTDAWIKFIQTQGVVAFVQEWQKDDPAVRKAKARAHAMPDVHGREAMAAGYSRQGR